MTNGQNIGYEKDYANLKSKENILQIEIKPRQSQQDIKLLVGCETLEQTKVNELDVSSMAETFNGSISQSRTA